MDVLQRILPYQTRRWSTVPALPRLANNSKDGPLKTRWNTYPSLATRMTSHHQRRARARAAVYVQSTRAKQAHRYRTLACHAECMGDRDGWADSRRATETRDPVYVPRMHARADVSIQRGTGSGRIHSAYPPKHKPNTPVEAPSADEYWAPLGPSLAPLHPIFRRQRYISLPPPTTLPPESPTDARVRPLAPLSIPPFP